MEPLLVEQAPHYPSQCCFCMQFQGPFIDTCIESEYGRLYVCAPSERSSGCAGQLAVAMGWVPPERLVATEELLAQAEETIRELSERLHEASQQEAGNGDYARIEMAELEGFFSYKRAKDYRDRKREKRQLEESEV